MVVLAIVEHRAVYAEEELTRTTRCKPVLAKATTRRWLQSRSSVLAKQEKEYVITGGEECTRSRPYTSARVRKCGERLPQLRRERIV